MAQELKRYAQGFQGNIAVATETTVLTPNGATKLGLLQVVIFNPTGGAITVQVHIRPTTNGAVDAAAQANRLVDESLASKARLVLSGTPYAILANGAVLSVNGSALGLNAWASAEVLDRDRS